MLSDAIHKRDVEAVKLLLKVGFPLNYDYRDPYNSDIVRAVQSGSYEIFKLLCQYNADFLVHDSEFLYQIDIHQLDGSVSISKNRSKHPILNFAIKGGSLEIIKDLIALGADINNEDVDGRTPLHIACLISSLPLIKFLVESNVNMNSRKKTGHQVIHDSLYKIGYSPLDCALVKGDLDIVKYLVINNAKYYEFYVKDLETLVWLHDSYPHFNNKSFTHYHALAYHGIYDIVEASHYVSNLHESHIIKTPLEIAIIRGHTKMVQDLITAYPEFKWKHRRLLFMAFEHQNYDLTQFLLTRYTPKWEKIVWYTFDSPNKCKMDRLSDIIKLYIAHGMIITPSFFKKVVSFHQLESVKYLLSSYSGDPNNLITIIDLYYHADIETFKYLVEAGININIMWYEKKFIDKLGERLYKPQYIEMLEYLRSRSDTLV